MMPGGYAWKRHIAGKMPTPPGGRGVIKGFSAGSRRRLQRKLAAIDWAEFECDFVSLTYHYGLARPVPEMGTDANSFAGVSAQSYCTTVSPSTASSVHEWGPGEFYYAPENRELRIFQKRLERYCGGLYECVIWRKELQERGVVHYHLIVIWKSNRPDGFSKWVKTNWNDIVAPDDSAALAHGVDVRPVVNKSGSTMAKLMVYLSKYMAKVEQLDGWVGRCWGVWGDLPVKILYPLVLTKRAYIDWTRRVRHWGKSRKSRFLKGITAARQGGLVLYDGRLLGQLFAGLEMNTT